jgi:hypothetical protein
MLKEWVKIDLRRAGCGNVRRSESDYGKHLINVIF